MLRRAGGSPVLGALPGRFEALGSRPRRASGAATRYRAGARRGSRPGSRRSSRGDCSAGSPPNHTRPWADMRPDQLLEGLPALLALRTRRSALTSDRMSSRRASAHQSIIRPQAATPKGVDPPAWPAPSAKVEPTEAVWYLPCGNWNGHPPQSASATALAIVGRGRVGSSLPEPKRRDRGPGGPRGLARPAAAPSRRSSASPTTAIGEACEALAASDTPALVGHVSGASGLLALESATRRGSAVFSFHPLQTFPDGGPRSPGRPARSPPRPRAPRASPTRWPPGSRCARSSSPRRARVAYHAAASIASNLLVALEESAAELLARAGVEDASELLAPLVLQTAANWAEHGPAALTGPVARGDEATVERHLEAAGRARARAARGSTTPWPSAPRARERRRRRRHEVVRSKGSCARRSRAARRDGERRSGSCRRWATFTRATSR